MSDLDRNKWNSRYAAGAYAERTHPSALLVDALAQHPDLSGSALDIACGAGRNALYLAERGFQVTGMDISDQALERAGQSAAELGLTVQWLQQDLDQISDLHGPYALICMVRYVNAPLLDMAAQALAPAGLLVVEQHLRSDAQVVGPQNPTFRVAAGELRRQAADLELISVWEGVTEDPDGQPAALARLVAQRRN